MDTSEDCFDDRSELLRSLEIKAVFAAMPGIYSNLVGGVRHSSATIRSCRELHAGRMRSAVVCLSRDVGCVRRETLCVANDIAQQSVHQALLLNPRSNRFVNANRSDRGYNGSDYNLTELPQNS